MFKKKSKKPLYLKKSKAAKQVEEDYDDYSLSEVTEHTEPQHGNYKPSQTKKRERNNRKYEYSEFEEQYDDRQYGYNYNDQDTYTQYSYNYDDSNMYDTSSQTGMYEYTTEESLYERQPGQIRRQTVTDSAYTEDSDSDCEICNERRGRRNRQITDDSEYTSMFDYPRASPRRKHVHKYGHKKRKRGLADTTESERDPYRKNYNVYLVHQPAEQGGFTYKQQREQKERGRDTTQTETELVSDEEEESKISITEPRRKQKYQVYAAQTEQVSGGVFEQKSPREKVMSETDHNRHFPIFGLKDKTVGSSESVVYLPVIVLDNTINLPTSSIISPESLTVTPEEKAEHSLKIIQIYRAADLGIGQGNIFEHARKDATGEILASEQDMTVNSLTQKQQSPLVTQKSTATIASKTEESKPNLQSEYPVQKSYINVAPQKHNTDATASHTNLKPTKESLNSHIIGLRSPKGSGFFSRVHKKDMKAKKEKKNKLQTQKYGENSGRPSEVMSMANPTLHEKETLDSTNTIPTRDIKIQGQNLIYNQSLVGAEFQHTGRPSIVNNLQDQTLENTNTMKSNVGDISQNTRRSVEGESKILQQKENLRQTLVAEITLPIQDERKSKAGERTSVVGATATPNQNGRKSVGEERKSVEENSAPLSQDGRRSVAEERRSVVDDFAPLNQDGRENITQEWKSEVGEAASLNQDGRKSNVGENIYAQPEQMSITEDRRSSVADERKPSFVEERTRSMSGDRRNVGQETTKYYIVNNSYQQVQVEDIYSPMSQSLQRSSSLAVPKKKKSIASRLFSRKKKGNQRLAPEQFSTNERNYEQEQLQYIPEGQEQYAFHEVETLLEPAPVEQQSIMQNRMLKQSSLPKKPPVEFVDQEETEKKSDLHQPLTFWEHDLTLLIHVFQTARFYLGLSLHDKLIEVLTTYHLFQQA